MSIFHFKKFSVEQDRTGMKVSTDAVVFGGWVTQQWKEKRGRVLDVGTGTGLLSLMLVQESMNLEITAIEPEPAAAIQAAENFQNSAWADKLALLETDMYSHSQDSSSLRYDYVICNPPFFQNQLQSTEKKRKLARHDALPMETLADASTHLTIKNGKIALIYPADVWSKWMKVAEEFNWYPERVLHIRPKEDKRVHRICGIFSRMQPDTETLHEQIAIYSTSGEYSKEISSLLSNYYKFL